LNYPLVYPLAARNVKQQADRGTVVEFKVEFTRGLARSGKATFLVGTTIRGNYEDT
jgi:hypothetical protein